MSIFYFLSIFNFYIFVMWVGVLSARMCVCHMCTWQSWRPKKVQDSLELDLQTVLSYHTGTGNQTWLFFKSSQCCHLLGHLSSPFIFTFVCRVCLDVCALFRCVCGGGFMCVWVHMCVHACGGLRLISGIILHHSSTLFTQAGHLNQTQSLLIWLV